MKSQLGYLCHIEHGSQVMSSMLKQALRFQAGKCDVPFRIIGLSVWDPQTPVVGVVVTKWTEDIWSRMNDVSTGDAA